jgi:DNA-binding response OmpR family regulator
MVSKAHRVLVVDDDPSLTDLLVDTLDAIGYEAISANSAEEALETLRVQHVSLVISDVNMPGMSGIDLVRELKRLSPEIPTMLITGVNTESIQEHAHECGADGYLAKPFRIGRMEQEIDLLLHGDGRRRVLLIDDNREFLGALHCQLEAAGNIVYDATSIAAARQILRQKDVDLVITDLKMPDGDGLQLFGEIRERSPNLPVIVVTAYATDEVLERIKRLGIQSFLPKPFDFRELESAITSSAPCTA